MANKWTPEQQQVIDIRGKNILVSAAAGSGKTAVLVERIFDRITDETDPVDIDSIVVVTFTRAAAAEMRERILKRILKALEEDPGDERLLRQSTRVHNAFICTIDSFCGYVVRNHFYELDLDPGFRVASEVELKQLGAEVLEKVLEERYESVKEKQASPFYDLVNTYCTQSSDAMLVQYINDLNEKADSFPWPNQWLESLLEPYRLQSVEDLAATPWIKLGVDQLRGILAEVMAGLEALLPLCEKEGGPKYMLGHLGIDLDACQAVCKLEDDAKFYDAMRQLDLSKQAIYNNAKIRGKDTTKEAADEVIKARKVFVDQIKDANKLHGNQPLKQLLAVLAHQRPMMEELVALVKAYREALLAQKKRLGVFSFGDIAHFALEILVDEESGLPTKTAQAFQEHFSEIMIDEYQDSNYIQEAILTSIARENNLFMVGDVKQSIYGFRQACPQLFIDKYHRYKADGELSVAIDLSKNFRSRPEVLDITNSMFYRLMHEDLGGVEYDDKAALYYGATSLYDPNPGDYEPEILIVDTNKKSLDEADLEDKVAFEAKVVADRIRELMGSLQVVDADTATLRPLRYSDIAILSRGTKSTGDEVIKLLRDNDVPAYTQSKTGYYESLEVRTVLNLLRVIDNPLQDIPLAAVLRSPIVGLGDEDLAWLKERGKALIFSLREADENLPGKANLDAFRALLDHYRSILDETPLHQLMRQIFDETGYLAYVTALPRGRQRRANLLQLIEEAVDFEGSSLNDLFQFIRYVEDREKYKEDRGEASLVSGSDDAVVLMTIHGSKGLEFPVVFVMGMGRGFDRRDSQSSLLLHSDFGMAIKYVNAEEHYKDVNLYHNMVKRAKEMDQDGEELRLLYVAMTRAREKLILVGGLEGSLEDELERTRLQQVMTSWEKPVEELTFTRRSMPSHYLAWVLMSTAADRPRYPFKEFYPEEVVVQEVGALMEKSQELEEARKKLLAEVEAVDEDALARLKEQMAFVYPYGTSTQFKNKYSVSEIKHHRMELAFATPEEDGIEEPEFLREELGAVVPRFILEQMDCVAARDGLAGQDPAAEADYAAGQATSSAPHINLGAARGTATHRFFECYDFTKEPSWEEMKAQLAAMVESGLMAPEDAELLSWKQLYAFLESDIAGRMGQAARANLLYKEQPFVMSESPAVLFPELAAVDEQVAEAEPVLIQGIIDVFWQEGDGLVLLDYKTDRIEKLEELDKRYHVQMQLYAEALQRSLGLPVKEKILYSLHLAEPFPLP